MPRRNSRTPTLEELLHDAVEAGLIDANTGLPAKIVQVNDDDTVDVKPLVKKNYVSEEGYTPIPVITKVPVQYLSTPDSHFLFPLKKDVYGWLVFGQRSIEQWFESGTDSEPVSPRHHHIKDAVFLIGPRPLTSPIQRKGAKTSLEIRHGKTWVEITEDGKFKITNGSVDLLDVLSDLTEALISGTVQTKDGPVNFTTPTIDSLKSVKSDLGKLKA